MRVFGSRDGMTSESTTVLDVACTTNCTCLSLLSTVRWSSYNAVSVHSYVRCCTAVARVLRCTQRSSFRVAQSQPAGPRHSRTTLQTTTERPPL